jgi:hypothetical protein
MEEIQITQVEFPTDKKKPEIVKKPKKGKHGASRKNPDHTGSIDSAGDANPFPDTLTQADLAIALDVPQASWDGPQP